MTANAAALGSISTLLEEEALYRFPDDPDARQQQQAGLDEGGKIFDFAVSILMIRVGWLIGNPDGKKRNDGGDQIEPGVKALPTECPTMPVVMPTTILSPVIAIAAQTEFRATARFSARIPSASNVPACNIASIIAVTFLLPPRTTVFLALRYATILTPLWLSPCQISEHQCSNCLCFFSFVLGCVCTDGTRAPVEFRSRSAVRRFLL